jgi:hypothetical protein
MSVVDVQEAKASRTIHSLTHSNSKMQVKVLFVVIAVTIMAITVACSAKGGISSSGKTTSTSIVHGTSRRKMLQVLVRRKREGKFRVCKFSRRHTLMFINYSFQLGCYHKEEGRSLTRCESSKGNAELMVGMGDFVRLV